MPKIIPSEELGAIVFVITEHFDGIGADGIRNAVGFDLPVRTLQRRLARLAAEGRIEARGTGRGKRYFPASLPLPELVVAETPDVSYATRKLSEEGE